MASIGLAMSIPGMAFADAAAGLFVAGMICMTGAEIMGEAVKQLTDTSDKELEDRIKVLSLESSEDIIEVKRIRARWMGSSAIVDVDVTTADNLSSSANRAVQEMLSCKIMEEESGVIDANVHATSNAVTCPLLTATKVHEEMKSVQELEDDARMILNGHDDVGNFFFFDTYKCFLPALSTQLQILNNILRYNRSKGVLCITKIPYLQLLMQIFD